MHSSTVHSSPPPSGQPLATPAVLVIIDDYVDVLSVHLESTQRREEDPEGGGLSHALNIHLVCSLDLLTTIYSSHPDDARQFAARFRLLQRLFNTLIAKSLDQRVRFMHHMVQKYTSFRP